MHFSNMDTVDTIEVRAAQAFAASRDCVTALNVDVIPNLQPRERSGPKRLLTAIDRRRIFEYDTLTELELLIDQVSRLVSRGSTQVEQFVADDCHIDGGGILKHWQRTPDAEALARALPLLLEFNEALLDVLDMAHALRALDELRRRI